MRKLKFLVLFTVIFASGCATFVTKEQAFPKMYNEQPKSILVVPAVNNTTAAEATEYYATTITEPLSRSGYYVLPLEVTNKLLLEEGITDGSQLQSVDSELFKSMFGADAVLFVTINEWDTSYYVIGGNVTVGIEYVLKSTTTSDVLWHYNDRMVVDTSGNSGGGLIGAIVSTAINTAMQDYVPVAKQVNYMALSSMPLGSYHEQHMKDQSSKAVDKAKMQAAQ